MPYPLSSVARRLSRFFRSIASGNRRYAYAANRATMETLESRTLLSATISVTGNSIAIPIGDITPIREDFTDFGPIGAKFGAVERTFIIRNTGDTTLTINSFKITGATREFLLSAAPGNSVAANGTTSFTIFFDPRSTGVKKGTITIQTNDPLNPTFTFKIQGTGLSTKILDGGLQVVTTQQGVGDGFSLLGQRMQVNYTGYLLDGTKFDSSLNDGHTPFEFTIGAGGVIQGWEKGLLGMKLGEKRTLIIPPDLAYGAAGQGNIPGNATLIFEVQLLALQGPTLVVTGNGTSIADGDTTPSTTDFTDFGDIGTNGTIVHTFIISQTGQGSLSKRLDNVVFMDGAGKDQFNITQPFTDFNNNTVFLVRYQPTKLGTAIATLTVATNDPEHPNFHFDISGTTSAPPPVDLNGVFSGKIVVPPQVGAADTFNAPVSVTNWGWLQASGTVLITVKASADGAWHDSDPTVGTATPIISLGKHVTKDFIVPITIPAPGVLAFGNYTLVAKIETVTDMGEINTGDNFVTSSLFGGPVGMKVVAAKPDLKVAIGAPSPNAQVFIPGSTVKIPVTITNAGIRTANASLGSPIHIDVRKSDNNTYDITDELLKQLSITSPLPAGKSVTMFVNYTIPLTGAPANFFAVAKADVDSVIDEIDENNNTGASASIPAGIKFGFINGGSKTVTFFDTDGTKVKMSLTHKGVGTVTKDANGYHLTLAGTDELTNVVISTTQTGTGGDDGRFTLNSLIAGTPGIDTVPVRSITAKTTDITGDFRVAGAASFVTVGNITGTGVISFGAVSFFTRNPILLKFTAGDVQDHTLTAVTPIDRLEVVRWRNTDATADTITTPYIQHLKVTGDAGASIAGDFQANITAAGPHGKNTNDPTLNDVKINGDLSGVTWAATGKIDGVDVKGNVSNSTIAGSSLGTIKIAGNVTATHFTATLPAGNAPAINSLTILGTMTGSDVRSTGNINTIRVGALVDSLVFAGVKNTVTGRPTTTTDFVTPISTNLPRINTITFTGIAANPTDPVLVNSSIAAGRINTANFPKRLTPVVSAGSGLNVFGFATRVEPVDNYDGPPTAGLFVSGDQSLIT